MIEYKRIPEAQVGALPELGKANWIMCGTVNDTIILYREMKKTRAEKKAERTPEYQKFHDAYPKKSGITSDKVINLLNRAVQEGKFDQVMQGVEKYRKQILVENITMKFVLNPQTFLNEKRWADPFDIMDNRLPVSEKWMLPYFEDIDDQQIKKLLDMKDQWEKAQKKDITPGVLQNMKNHILGIE